MIYYGKSGKVTNLRKSLIGTELYDSNLERDYMFYLENSPWVRSWTKKHGIVIPYTFLGFRRSYLPDFLIETKSGDKEIHETKGLPFLLWLSVSLKRESAERWCKNRGYRYKFVTRSTIPFYNPEELRKIEGSQTLN